MAARTQITAPAHPDTVEVLAGLIAELDAATEAGEFYDHVCEALCRLTSLQRAGITLYDSASRAVHFAGTHGVDKALAAQLEATLDEAPMAQRALAEDRAVWASEHLEREVPPRYARFAGMTTVTCAPVAAGGRWFGAMWADRGGGRFEPTEEECQTMLTLGRVAALAASVERSTSQRERARQLSDRIALAREIHERVMQRLFGLALALGSGEPLSAADQRAAHDELQAALGELRSALGRPLASHGASKRTSLRHLVHRRAERMPALRVRWQSGLVVPPRLEELSQSVFLEALRNIEKHAEPTRIEVEVRRTEDAFELEVSNDGVGLGRSRNGANGGARAGIGLRLLTLEALQQNALVEFGSLPDDRWRVRLVAAVGAEEEEGE